MELDKCGALGALLAGKVIEIIGARLTDNKWTEVKKLIPEISNPAHPA
jgi:hypothetical protein